MTTVQTAVPAEPKRRDDSVDVRLDRLLGFLDALEVEEPDRRHACARQRSTIQEVRRELATRPAPAPVLKALPQRPSGMGDDLAPGAAVAAAAPAVGSRAEQTAQLVRRAAAGDEAAWEELYRRFDRLLRTVGSQLGLGREESADAAQNTWCELLRHVDRIRQPESIGSWLVTTMRRECVRSAVAGRREQMVDDWNEWPLPDVAPGSDRLVVQADRDRILWTFVDRLPPRQRQLLHALAAEPTGSYRRAAEALCVSTGSVGPTRVRALRRLRELLCEAGMTFHELVLQD